MLQPNVTTGVAMCNLLLWFAFDVFHKKTIRYCYHEDFMKKYWKLPEICSKNFKNRKFSFTPCREEATWQLPRAARAMKCFQKSANRILVPSSKNHMHINADIFHEKIVQQEGPLKEWVWNVALHKALCASVHKCGQPPSSPPAELRLRVKWFIKSK